MARSNPNTNAAGQSNTTTRRSFLGTGSEKPEANMEPNLFYIVGAFLAIKEPEDVTAWLASDEHDAGKLIMFVNAVCKEYDKLATENNNLVKINKELSASKTQKNGVI